MQWQVFVFFLVGYSSALNNGLGRTPQMGKSTVNFERLSIGINVVLGWNSWNHFGCNINEKLIQQTADTIVATGLAAAGYEFGSCSILPLSSN